MLDFYNILGLDHSANKSEIEAKIDDQYNKWRRLVTHHDSKIVSEANQALNILEKARTTLLDPAKRITYDQQLATNTADLGGLADPEAGGIPQFSTPSMVFSDGGSAKPQQPSAFMDRTDAWVCTNTKCKKANPIGTIFCASCGIVIGHNCPSCGEFVEFSNKFCSKCGADKEKAFYDILSRKINDEREVINQTRNTMNAMRNNPMAYIMEEPEMKWQKGCFGVYHWISFAIAIPASVVVMSKHLTMGILLFFFVLIVMAFRTILPRQKAKKSVLRQAEGLEGDLKVRELAIKRMQAERYRDTITTQ